MRINIALSKRALMLATAGTLVVAGLSPVFGSQSAEAAQVTSRSIRVTSSVISATDVTYNVNFTTGTTSPIQGIVIDFCSNSPLVGTTCTAPAGFDTNEVTLALGTQVGVTGFTKDAATTPNKVVLVNAAGASVNSGVAVTIPLGTAAANDGLTNPSGLGTYYARIVTYATTAGATAYDSATVNANNPGTHVDDGGIALSTARQLTVNARVQEQLEFCVGAIASTVIDPASTPANCSAFPTATTVDIGVVDSAAPSISPVATSSGGNNTNGGVMIRTNAVNGATISYFAEQNGSSGRLKVAGATCSGTTTTFDTGSSTTDQCFNSNADQDHADNNFSVVGEKFGMTSSSVLRPTGSTTTNLTRDLEYDGTGAAAGGFAWDQSGTNDPATTLASSSSVLDYEMLVLRFAARSAATTPTGSYAVTSTYIATSTF